MTQSSHNRPRGLPQDCKVIHKGDVTREEWHKYRLRGLGGSDIPAVSGTSPWKSKLDVWAYKTGAYRPADEMTEAMKAGVMLEPSVLAWWEDETGWKALCQGWMLQSTVWPVTYATMDAIGQSPDDPMVLRVVEAKTTRSPRSWKSVPPYYRDQVLWQQFVTGLKDLPGQIPVLHGGINFEVWDVEWDEDRFKVLYQKAEEFWHQVQTKERPVVSEPQDYDALKHLVTIKKGTKIVDNKTEQLVTEYHQVKAAREELAAKEKLLKAKIVEAMEGHDTLMSSSGRLLAKSQTYPRTTYDKGLKTTLQEEYPELYDRYVGSRDVTRYEIADKDK